MPYASGDAPPSYKNLDPDVKGKAVEILNALLRDGKMDEGTAIATALAKAREWVANHADDGDGKWITVNGRHIQIKDGESVEDAMHHSGIGKSGGGKSITAKAILRKVGRGSGILKGSDVSIKMALDGIGKKLETATKQDVIEALSKDRERWASGMKSGTTPARVGQEYLDHFDALLSRVRSFSEVPEDEALTYAEHDNSIKGIEIFGTGTHNGDEYTEQDLDDMVTAFGALDYRPAIKVGHTKDKPGAPSYGWVTNLRKVGTKLVADFESMHDSVVEALRNKSYDRVSSEIYFNLNRGGKLFKRALKAVALLGAEVPAVAGLVPLHKMDFAEDDFEGEGAYAEALSIPPESFVDALAERVSGLVNLMKEYDMAKNASKVAALKAQVAELSAKMDAMKKKAGDGEPDDDDKMMMTNMDKEIKKCSEDIALLEAEDAAEGKAELKALQEQLAAERSAREKAEKNMATFASRMDAIERDTRNKVIGEKIKACTVPAFRPGLEGLYAYALEHPETKVKVYAKDKDNKDVASERTLADVVDGFVSDINTQAARLFRALAVSGAKPREEGGSDEPEDASAAFNEKVAEYRAAHPEVKKYEDAMKAVRVLHPDLYKQYSEQLAHAGDRNS